MTFYSNYKNTLKSFNFIAQKESNTLSKPTFSPNTSELNNPPKPQIPLSKSSTNNFATKKKIAKFNLSSNILISNFKNKTNHNSHYLAVKTILPKKPHLSPGGLKN